MMRKAPKAVIIAGPTASGKSSLAVRLSLILDGEIVNADSMQVYRGMDIGTAKPTLSERHGIPHHMLDVVNPDEEFNASRFRSMALPLIEDTCSRGKTCFVVGGTGLYIKSLLGGLLECPPADTGLREQIKRDCSRHGSGELHKKLSGLDPEAANKIHPNDRIRIMRALEVYILTGRTISELSSQHRFGEKRVNALKLCLEIDRKQLYSRIDFRSVDMVKNGLVQETGTLLGKGYSEDLKPMNAIGYRHMIKFIKGEWSLDEATRKLQRDTRRYAKRQLTWFRADKEYVWVEPGNFTPILERIKEFVSGVA